MDIYVNNFLNAENVGWIHVPEAIRGDLSQPFVIHDRQTGLFKFVSTAEAFEAADGLWHRALEARFGKRAGDFRYTPEGRGELGSDLWRAWTVRDLVWKFRDLEMKTGIRATAQPATLDEK